ncbi:Saposin-like type B, region 1 family protein, partial [Musa troglodytarum]
DIGPRYICPKIRGRYPRLLCLKGHDVTRVEYGFAPLFPFHFLIRVPCRSEDELAIAPRRPVRFSPSIPVKNSDRRGKIEAEQPPPRNLLRPCQAGIERLHSQIKVSKVVEGDDQLCKLCENFTAQATQYLGENKTRTEIIETLHQACAELKPFKEQIHPEEFCTKFSLCQERLSVKSDDACSLCRGVIAKLLMKLQDPDTQFEVIKMLLQECNMVEHYVQELI